MQGDRAEKNLCVLALDQRSITALYLVSLTVR